MFHTLLIVFILLNIGDGATMLPAPLSEPTPKSVLCSEKKAISVSRGTQETHSSGQSPGRAGRHELQPRRIFFSEGRRLQAVSSQEATALRNLVSLSVFNRILIFSRDEQLVGRARGSMARHPPPADAAWLQVVASDIQRRRDCNL